MHLFIEQYTVHHLTFYNVQATKVAATHTAVQDRHASIMCKNAKKIQMCTEINIILNIHKENLANINDSGTNN